MWTGRCTASSCHLCTLGAFLALAPLIDRIKEGAVAHARVLVWLLTASIVLVSDSPQYPHTIPKRTRVGLHCGEAERAPAWRGRSFFPPHASSAFVSGEAPNRSCVNHDATLPPTRDTRPYRRPSTQRASCAQSVLCCLKALVSADPKTPFRSYPIRHPKIPRRAVEEDLPEPFQLPRLLRAQSLHSWYFDCHSRRCERRWLDSHL